MATTAGKKTRAFLTGGLTDKNGIQELEPMKKPKLKVKSMEIQQELTIQENIVSKMEPIPLIEYPVPDSNIIEPKVIEPKVIEQRTPYHRDESTNFDNEFGTFPGSKWQHYKGEIYIVVTTAIHAEDGCVMVVYQNIRNKKVYVRPGYIWVQQINENGTKRFTLI